jgi:hypothetical protein
MVTLEGSRTLILVCRQAFGGIIERVLRREGFRDFQRGRLTLASGPAVGPGVGEVAGEIFVLMTDVNSESRIKDLLRACPIRGDARRLFALYTVAD